MFSVKISTSKGTWLVNNPCLSTLYGTIKCKDDMFYKQLFKSANSISLSNGNLSCLLNFKTTNYYYYSYYLLFYYYYYSYYLLFYY